MCVNYSRVVSIDCIIYLFKHQTKCKYPRYYTHMSVVYMLSHAFTLRKYTFVYPNMYGHGTHDDGAHLILLVATRGSLV